MVEFRKGADQFAVRWKTLNDLIDCSLDSAVIICIPVAPVPMTPRRLPARSRLAMKSLGHLEVWNAFPAKDSTPGMLGSVGADKKPTQLIKNVVW